MRHEGGKPHCKSCARILLAGRAQQQTGEDRDERALNQAVYDLNR